MQDSTGENPAAVKRLRSGGGGSRFQRERLNGRSQMQAFAIQAGREVRVIASARDTTDESAAKVCRDIARAFEEQLTYPGEIKVTVLRESRFSETAK